MVCIPSIRRKPVLGIVIGLMMVSPTLPNAWVVVEDPSKAATYFGIFHHVVGFQNSVLPAFFVGLIGAKLEKWLHKKIPDVLDLLLVPLFTLTIMSFPRFVYYWSILPQYRRICTKCN